MQEQAPPNPSAALGSSSSSLQSLHRPGAGGWTAQQPPACGKTFMMSCDFSPSPSRCFSTDHWLPRESQLSPARASVEGINLPWEK